MANPFGTDNMAAGYALSRPPVHPRVVERAFPALSPGTAFQRALDVGCGAGISTEALTAVAKHRIGLEPAHAMLQWAPRVSPEADFLVGEAEALPLRARSVDLIAAAGSLNYANLDRFFPEAARVLAPGGELLVYDFSPGRSFVHNHRLDDWFEAFMQRYPAPVYEGRTLSPELLAPLATGLHLRAAEHFEIPVTLNPSFYLDYMLTETNVAAAVRSGTPLEEIRRWCAMTLAPVWEDTARPVIFRGYFACFAVN
jgi:SAM-dependent methyltransferase